MKGGENGKIISLDTNSHEKNKFEFAKSNGRNYSYSKESVDAAISIFNIPV